MVSCGRFSHLWEEAMRYQSSAGLTRIVLSVFFVHMHTYTGGRLHTKRRLETERKNSHPAMLIHKCVKKYGVKADKIFYSPEWHKNRRQSHPNHLQLISSVTRGFRTSRDAERTRGQRLQNKQSYNPSRARGRFFGKAECTVRMPSCTARVWELTCIVDE